MFILSNNQYYKYIETMDRVHSLQPFSQWLWGVNSFFRVRSFDLAEQMTIWKFRSNDFDKKGACEGG
jgi:hypothetical protein